MDFSVIENHPWATTAVVGLGGLGLYLLLRGGGGDSSGGGGGGAVYASGPSDSQVAANAALQSAQIQANAQTTQLSAQLAALGIQTDAQIKAAQIGAEVSKDATHAALASDLYRTSAELTYGLSSQDTAIQIARINAGVQQSYIDRMTGGPIGAAAVPIRAAVPMPEPIYSAPINQVTQVQTPAGVGPIVPGGMPLIAWPDYASCDPLDVACVSRNQGLSDKYGLDLKAAQASNNYAQCVANAGNATTPEQYAAVMARCEGQRSLQS